MDNEICEARVGFSRHAAWVLHVIRFGLDATPVANIAHEFRHGCGILLMLPSRPFCPPTNIRIRDAQIDAHLFKCVANGVGVDLFDDLQIGADLLEFKP
jgi:hypothetical protein